MRPTSILLSITIILLFCNLSSASEFETYSRDFEDMFTPVETPSAAPISVSTLSGKIITISPGHGWTWTGSGWGFQRSYWYGIVEDIVNADIISYLKDYLEGSGADVRCTRDVDNYNKMTASLGNYPATSYPWREMAAKYYLQRILPRNSEIWNDLLVSSEGDKDIRTRPNYANWKNTAGGISGICVSVHNNGGGGTGTETWYDTTNGQTDKSLVLAQKIQSHIIGDIRAKYNSAWRDRGVKGAAGSYGENRINKMPSVLTEVAFMDMQSPDNDALHSEDFKKLAARAIYNGICDYFGVTPPSTLVIKNLGFIRKGWNLVSFPYQPLNGVPESMLGNINFKLSRLQTWNNNVEGGGYLSYGLTWTGNIAVGKAYWIFETAAKDLSYEYDFNHVEGHTITVPAHQRVPYWVMFGVPGKFPANCSDVTFNTSKSPNPVPWQTAVTNGWIEKSVQGFDAGIQSYFTANPDQGLSNKTTLDPWYGYWMIVKTKDALTLTLP